MAEVNLQLKAAMDLELNADDKFTPAIQAVFEKTQSKFTEMNSMMQTQARAYQASWQGIIVIILGVIAAIAAIKNWFDDSIAELHETLKSIEGQLKKGIKVVLDTDAARKAVQGIVEEVSKLEKPRFLTLNVAQAIRAAEVVKKVLKAIPDSVDRTLALDVSQALSAAGAVKGAIDAIPDVTYKTVIVQYLTQASPVRPFTEGMKYIRAEMESLPSEGTYTVRFGGAEARPGGVRAPSSGAGTRDVTFSPTIYINGAAGREGRELAGEIDRALAEKWRYNRSELRRAMAI